MSMTISAANYMGSAHQNTQVPSGERPKDAPAEPGKTERSSVSASLDQASLGEDGVSVTEVSRQQGAEQSKSQRHSAVPSRDTVEISEEGKAASARLQKHTSETATAEKTQYEAEDLSEYTDTELKQMYYNGEITLQEYEDETGETPV